MSKRSIVKDPVPLRGEMNEWFQATSKGLETIFERVIEARLDAVEAEHHQEIADLEEEHAGKLEKLATEVATLKETVRQKDLRLAKQEERLNIVRQQVEKEDIGK